MPSHEMIRGCGLESLCQASEHAPRDKTGWATNYAFRLRETAFFPQLVFEGAAQFKK